MTARPVGRCIGCFHDFAKGPCGGCGAVDHPAPPTVIDQKTAANLVAISRWIDEGNADRDPEAVTWGRLAKITEEAGEVIGAYIGYTGQNPRKGRTHQRHEVIEELLDVAVTALGAVEHLGGHHGLALNALALKIDAVAARAGVKQP